MNEIDESIEENSIEFKQLLERTRYLMDELSPMKEKDSEAYVVKVFRFCESQDDMAILIAYLHSFIQRILTEVEDVERRKEKSDKNKKRKKEDRKKRS